MLEILLIWWLVLNPPPVEHPPVREQGIATYYNPFGADFVYVRGKRVNMCPSKLACSWWGYKARPEDLFLAHRSLPCGMTVWVKNPRTRKTATAVVLDRGTFGAMGCYQQGSLRCVPCGALQAKPGWCIKIYKNDPGRWRGIADLSPALTEALGHNGMEKVQILYTQQALQRARQEWRQRREAIEKHATLQNHFRRLLAWLPGRITTRQ